MAFAVARASPRKLALAPLMRTFAPLFSALGLHGTAIATQMQVALQGEGSTAKVPTICMHRLVVVRVLLL